jgi:hypothetical protein
LASLDYSPEENGGVEFETGMKKIHAVLPNNEVIEGVEVVCVFVCTYCEN